MGQAKIRKSKQMSLDEISTKVDIENLARVIRHVCTAASGSHGSDCYLHAWLAKRLLDEKGVPAVIEVGNAAWRVGSGDGDVLSHVTPEEHIDRVVEALQSPGQRGALMYHAWVRVADQWIFDPTTYLIPEKARALDEMDGSRTFVEWKPDFLFEKLERSHDFETVVNAYEPCFFYKKDARLQNLIERGFEGSDDDYAMVALAYRNPQAMVIGPNNLKPRMR